MTDADATPKTCPNCGTKLARVEMPEAAGFAHTHHLACFNDECPYYVQGWTWMFEQFGVKSSYRYRIDPSGHASPLAVWSPAALRSSILPDDGKTS